MQRQTQELINFYVNYRSGIICRRHSSIAAARIEENNASRKGGPPAPKIETGAEPSSEFPYWVALDKHTPEGKLVLTRVAKEVNSSHRKLIWSSFYCESACVNRLMPSPWWDAEKTWRLRRAGLSVSGAEELWSRLAISFASSLKRGQRPLRNSSRQLRRLSVTRVRKGYRMVGPAISQM